MFLSNLNIILLGWECLFCLVAAISLLELPSGEKKDNLIAMQLGAAFLLACEGLSWYFQGRPGIFARWMLRLTNCGSFLMNNWVLLLFHRYLCSAFLTVQERARLRLVKAVEFICYIGMGLVIVSWFTGLYYRIDGANNYVRGGLFPLSFVPPVAGLVLDGVLMQRYRDRVSKGMFRVMMAYLILPFVAALIQFVSYGLALISLSVGGAMLLIFLIVNREQQAELRKVQEDRAVVAQRLEIAQTLNRCVEELSSGKDISTAIRDLLWVIKDYFHAERAYVFENDVARRVTVNTYESVEPGVVPQIGNLQEVPLDTISMWMKQFQRGKKYYIANIEQELGTPHYNIIKDQGIYRLLTVPLLEQGKVIGFVGVDNPQQHYEDETLLASLQYFVANALRQKKEQEYLQQLSFHDQLTGLYNQNRYNRTLQNWNSDCQTQVGILYIDLNSLKKTNDLRGHAAGDLLIRNAARVLEETFPGYAYRIGGDEFVVIRQGISQEQFREEARALRERAESNAISFSVGVLWKETCPDLPAALREADGLMYEEKRKYHNCRD